MEESTKTPKTQIWFCSECKSVGSVPIVPFENLISLWKRIDRSHEKEDANCAKTNADFYIISMNPDFFRLEYAPEWAQEVIKKLLESPS